MCKTYYYDDNSYCINNNKTITNAKILPSVIIAY